MGGYARTLGLSTTVRFAWMSRSGCSPRTTLSARWPGRLMPDIWQVAAMTAPFQSGILPRPRIRYSRCLSSRGAPYTVLSGRPGAFNLRQHRGRRSWCGTCILLTGKDHMQKTRGDDRKSRPSSGSFLIWPSSTPRYRAHPDTGKQLQLVVNLGEPSLNAARCRVRLSNEGIVGIRLHIVQQREGLLPKEHRITHLCEQGRVTMYLPQERCHRDQQGIYPGGQPLLIRRHAWGVRISQQVEIDVRQVPRRILPLLKFQQADAPRLGINEQRRSGGNITLDESRAIQVIEHPVDLAAHQRQRGLPTGPVVARCAGPLQDLASIAVEPDSEATRQADAFKRRVFRQQMPQV